MLRAMVVIPVYNHAAAIGKVLSQTASLGYDIIVVNDGSTDETPDVLDAWCRANPDAPVEVISHQTNLGKAAALHTGFARASLRNATHVATIDADGQLEPGDIPLLIEEAHEAPHALIIGRRPERIPGCPARCHAGRRYATLAVLTQTGLRLSDTQCGLRVYPLDILAGIHCRAARYAFEAEVITRMVWDGREIREVPVRCHYFTGTDRVSHWKPFRDTLRHFWVHLSLLIIALLPITRVTRTRVAPAHASPPTPPHNPSPPTHTPRSHTHRLLNWLNPMRSWREVRSGSIGDLELAFGLGLGAWIGTLPFFGFHTILSVYVAWRLHQQPAAVVLGSQVSMPPFGVLLAAASISLGHLILTGSPSHANLSELTWASLWQIPVQGFTEWMIGSLVLGPLMGLVAFFVGLWIARRARRPIHAPSIG